MPRLKASLIVGKLVILLINFLLILVLGEWLFPKFLDKIPLRLYGSIDKNLRILAQSSKKDLLPNEYIAIVGDSIAVGAGDWLEEGRKNRFLGSPDYSPAHLIYKKTGMFTFYNCNSITILGLTNLAVIVLLLFLVVFSCRSKLCTATE